MTDLADTIENLIGARPTYIVGLSGGCVGEVYKVSMPNGHDLVAKVGDDGSGLALEGWMLTYLTEHSNLPVPRVHLAEDRLLVMDFVASGGGLGPQAQIHAADLVADLHALTTSNGFGFDCDTVIGGLSQPNPWQSSWLSFFRDHRLMSMGREAERDGRLAASMLLRLERFASRLDHWLDEPDQPSLIHGDMWTGNVLSDRGRITGFIDPALYYADCEIELAFTTLFGTFGSAFFDRYSEHRPLKPGFFEERVDIYNLYPLLVHVRLFGGSYVQSVDRTLRRFGF
jgi:fructosamine-3-kinase